MQGMEFSSMQNKQSEFFLPYGKKVIRFSSHAGYLLQVVLPRKVAPIENPMEAVRQSIRHPLKDQRLPGSSGQESVAIAINDKPPHTSILLPPS